MILKLVPLSADFFKLVPHVPRRSLWFGHTSIVYPTTLMAGEEEDKPRYMLGKPRVSIQEVQK